MERSAEGIINMIIQRVHDQEYKCDEHITPDGPEYYFNIENEEMSIKTGTYFEGGMSIPEQINDIFRTWSWVQNGNLYRVVRNGTATWLTPEKYNNIIKIHDFVDVVFYLLRITDNERQRIISHYY